MKKIILACSQANHNLAEQLQRDLGPVGMELNVLTDQAGPLPPALQQTSEPVVLIVTDNFLTGAYCMRDFLPVLKEMIRQNRLIAVLADGIRPANGETVPTRIERMADMLHYLNYWQNAYLNLITQQQQLPPEQRAALEPQLQEAQAVTGQVADIITTLKDTLYFSWNQLTGADYKLLFHQLDLSDVHEKYLQSKQAAVAIPTPVQEMEEPALSLASAPAYHATPHVPPPPPGPVRFTPVEPEEAPAVGTLNAIDDLIRDIPSEMITAKQDFSTLPPSETDIQRTIDDAWLWIRNGHVERGLEVFQFALEQYPHHEKLRTDYLLALSNYARDPEAAERQLEILHDNGLEEAKSYDLMGEIARAKGDYLFAKYSWDRALQINPDYPGLYRKLGLLTSEHLPDYRETAVHYLKAALVQTPSDVEVNYRLGQLLVQLQEPDEARMYLERTLEIDPLHGLAKGLLDKLSQAPTIPQDTPAAGPAEVFPETQEPVSIFETDDEPLEASPDEIVETQAELETPALPRTDIKTVLITGATSGIGRATAELFARHGHRVMLTGRRMERLEALKHRFSDIYKNDTFILSFDIRDPQAVEDAIHQLPDEWKEVDILVNNAGLAKGLAPIHEGQLDHWDTMIDTNIKGLLYITRLITPGMIARRRGHIINIGSSAGKEAYPNGNVYCATKFAVDALTKAMRMDLYMHNIRVSQVSPGHVEETEFAITRFDGDAERARIYENFQPLKASDVAETIYFIASRPPHVNIQDVFMFSTQQAGSTMIDRSGR